MPVATMRGFFSLFLCILCSHLIETLVIPDADALSAAPFNPIVEYVLNSQAEAQLRFIINAVDAHWGYPILHLVVGKAEQQCHDTNVTLEDKPLDAPWLDHHAVGDGQIAAYNDARVSWTMTCLTGAEDVDEDGTSASPELTQVLSWRIVSANDDDTAPGFTVAFKQSDGGPSLLRFEPHYTSPQALILDQAKWRSATSPFSMTLPSPPAAPESPSSPEIAHVPITPLEPLLAAPSTQIGSTPGRFTDSIQKSLGAKVQAVRQSMYDRLQSIKAKLCPHTREEALKLKAQQVLDALSHPMEHSSSLDPDASPVISAEQQHNGNETRSIGPTTTQNLDTFEPSSVGVQTRVVAKSFGLSMVVIAILAWLLLRCRDPRRRAERAARREERQTKRLYRRAARRQMVVNMIWNFRMKYRLASRETLQEDEKRRRVSEQDEVLANIFKDEIQSLRNAHRDVAGLTNSGLVEEGRSGYVYETDGLGRRRVRSTRSRSVSTLPEYAAEVSRPPSYRETSRRSSLAGFTTDSSVVSTSPRISRDGTNSDIDEKIEELDLRVTKHDALGRLTQV